MRSWLACSFALVAGLTGVARADVPADTIDLILRTPTAPEFADEDMDADKFKEPTTEDKPRQFNLARCVCDEAGSVQNVVFNAQWVPMMRPADPGGTKLFAWAGSDCAGADSLADRQMSCTSLPGLEDATELDDGQDIFVRVGALLTPGTNATGCSEDRTSVTYGLYTSADSEATITKIVEESIDVDMNAPPLPDAVDVSAQEGQISLSWDAINSEGGDIEYFQALCSLRDGTAAHDDPTDSARYDTAFTLCGLNLKTTLEPFAIENDDEQTGDPITASDLADSLKNLDETFICGQSAGSTARGITLGNLENGLEYEVVLVAVDKAGNAAAAFVPRVIAPQPVTDFWEDVNNENSELEGGMCLIESTFGGGGGGGLYGALRGWRDELSTSAAGRWLVARYYAWGAPIAAAAEQSVVVRVIAAVVLAPLIVIALAWHTLGLPLLLALIAGLVWWRRRRRALLTAALVLAPALASAQSTTPYWDESFVESDEVDVGPRFHLGLRVGPFLPAIDDERFATPGPYQRMYGGDGWMPSLDLHRLWNTVAGQFGAGLSAGYFGKTADAYAPCTTPVGQPPCMPTERAPGNDTKLRIVPIELTAIYRASQLDDNWGIPFIPYARGGLAYSVWWVRRPDGELSKACDGTMETCDRGIGASLGLVGAVGLAVRAERIDADAARSMRDSGLDHAGFYAEYSMSWVDGFGNEKKLSLGDATWSAGVDFEF